MPKLEEMSPDAVTFVDSGCKLADSNLTPELFETIVSQLTEEERPKFLKLLLGLAERLQSEQNSDA